jgi:hypothetical protein
MVSAAEGQPLIDAARAEAAAALLALRPGSGPLADEAAGRLRRIVDANDPAVLSLDAARFKSVYHTVGILPPDQYLALVLQATEGCSWNACTFCHLYRGLPFRVKTVREFEEHLEAVRRFFGESITLRRSLFLGAANALCVCSQRMVPLMEAAVRAFPRRPRAACTPSSTPGRAGGGRPSTPATPLSAFAAYVGLESGDPHLLSWLRKPGTPEDALSLVEALHEGGIGVAVIVLLGPAASASSTRTCGARPSSSPTWTWGRRTSSTSPSCTRSPRTSTRGGPRRRAWRRSARSGSTSSGARSRWASRWPGGSRAERATTCASSFTSVPEKRCSMKTTTLDKKADLAGPGSAITTSSKLLPAGYHSLLDTRQTQRAIFALKGYIEERLCNELNLMMVAVPLLVEAESGVNDYLDRDGSRAPIQFHVSNDRDLHPLDVQIVQAATKWKRMALRQFGMVPGEGLSPTCGPCARTTSSTTTTAPTSISGTGRRSSPPTSATSVS